MNDDTDILAAAIDRVIAKRGGKCFGRIGYLLLVLIDDRDYLLSDLTTNREKFITMLSARANELRRRGLNLTFSEIETGENVLIERNSDE